MRNRIEIAPGAQRTMRKLPPEPRRRLDTAIQRLADEPRPAGVRKLSGTADRYRIRVGDYRILYQIRDNVLIIVIVEIGHRRNIYEK